MFNLTMISDSGRVDKPAFSVYFGGYYYTTLYYTQWPMGLNGEGDLCSMMCLLSRHDQVKTKIILKHANIPAQDLVFHIFSSSKIIAERWDISPISLKTFIFATVYVGNGHPRICCTNRQYWQSACGRGRGPRSHCIMGALGR